MKKSFVVFLLFLIVNVAFALSPEKVMSKIDRETKKADKCKCLSKVQEIDGASVKFFYSKRKKLVKIIERRVIDGISVFRYFYFDKKTESLIAVNLIGTIFYYYDADYFAVISRDNFSEADAEKKGLNLKKVVKNYKEKVT